MSAGGDGSDGDDAAFLDAMRGVTPKSKKTERVAPARTTGARVKAPSAPRITVDGAEGRAPGVNNKQLKELRTGNVAVGHTVDLHGMRAEPAKDALRRRIDTAAATGVRCVLIIHGKGRHSSGAPILRDVAIATLTSAPTSRLVKAFCPAHPKDGGPGAMYVLL